MGGRVVVVAGATVVFVVGGGGGAVVVVGGGAVVVVGGGAVVVVVGTTRVVVVVGGPAGSSWSWTASGARRVGVSAGLVGLAGIEYEAVCDVGCEGEPEWSDRAWLHRDPAGRTRRSR